MKLIIFGIGQYYSNRKGKLFELCEEAEIVGYIDNKAKAGMTFEGKEVLKPEQMRNTVFDKILLMSKSYLQMKSQLIDLGFLEEEIWTWDQFVCEMSHGKYEFFCAERTGREREKRLLIISTDLGYNGGSIAAGYAAKELAGTYDVVLAAPRGDKDFIREMVADGIHILLCPAIPYLGREEQYLIEKFDVVVVNVFQMLPVACQVSALKPTIWWIHESKSVYQDILNHYASFLNCRSFNKINIRAVSNWPKKNFNFYFPNRIQSCLAYGIPDKYVDSITPKKNDKFVFAIIGGVVPIKAQDIFVKAVELLPKKMMEEKSIEYWIIGGISESGYGKEVRELAQENTSIRIKGRLTRQEIEAAYQEIDVVVCPSLEDSLPIVMTEGMMYSKVCIASDVTGTAEYMKDKVNGLICKSGNVEDLAEKMEWVINHPERLKEIGINARRTYLEHFTMEKFGERLKDAIQETIDNYEGEFGT